MKTICCVCQKTKISLKLFNIWLLLGVKKKETLSHGYCPKCYKETMNKWGLLSQGQNYNLGEANR